MYVSLILDSTLFRISFTSPQHVTIRETLPSIHVTMFINVETLVINVATPFFISITSPLMNATVSLICCRSCITSVSISVIKLFTRALISTTLSLIFKTSPYIAPRTVTICLSPPIIMRESYPCKIIVPFISR